jgi:hypothetical protein
MQEVFLAPILGVKILPNAKDIPAEYRMFAMFVGKYDAGKSTAAASFPGKKFVLDFDGRITSLRGRADVDFESFSSSAKGFKEADSQIEQLVVQGKMAYGKFPYNMVMFDSLSMGRKFLLTDAMKYTTGQARTNEPIRGRKIGELYLPTFQDYGYESEAVWQLLYDGLKKLPCNVVVTGHTIPEFKTISEPGKPAERIEVGEKIYGDPQLLAVLPIAFNEIYYFSKEIDPAGKIRRFVEFDGQVARTTYPELSKAGKVEITGKSFYEVWSSLVNPKTETTEAHK